jgi:pyridoxine 5-phosphate synthase
MPFLYLKVDSAALYRNLYEKENPDPSHIAVLAEMAGVDGVCCHLREDRMHITERDVYLLKEIVKTRLVLQIAPESDLIDLALEVKPWMVTLMPECSRKPYVEKGIEFQNNQEKYLDAGRKLNDSGINVCCYIDPDDDDVKEVARMRAYAVELCTYDYVSTSTGDEKENELDRLKQMAQLAEKLGMKAHCGGGLNYKNIFPIQERSSFAGFTIGNAIIGRAMMVGFEQAIEEMIDIVNTPLIE